MKAKWLERLIEKFGSENVAGASKHSRGKKKPKNWRKKKDMERKRAKLMRRKNR